MCEVIEKWEHNISKIKTFHIRLQLQLAIHVHIFDFGSSTIFLEQIIYLLSPWAVYICFGFSLFFWLITHHINFFPEATH